MLKRISIFTLFISLASVAFSNNMCMSGKGCALTLTGPAIDSLACSASAGDLDTSILTFTVTNHTSSPIKFTPSFGGADPSPSSLTITGGTCIKNAVTANDSCTILVTVTAALCTTIMPPQIFNALLIVTPDINQTEVTSAFQVTVTGTPVPFISIASGQQSSSTASIMGSASAPVLAVHDANGNWTTQAPSPTAIPSGIFNASTCSGQTASSTCVAVGQGGNNTLLYVSKDGGVTWAMPSTITNFPPSAAVPGELYGVSCIESGTTNCWAVGQILDNTGTTGLNDGALIIATTDGGNTWTAQNPQPFASLLFNFSSESILYSAFCGTTGCFAAGTDYAVVSNIVGGFVSTSSESFRFVTTTGSSVIGYTPMSTDCAGSTCIVAGYVGGTSSTSGFVAVSTNNWSNFDLTTLGNNSDFLTGVSCTETTVPSTKVACALVGYNNFSTPPFYVNTDVATNPGTWTRVSSVMPSSPWEFYAVTCETSSDNSTPICMVGGLITPVATDQAYLLQSSSSDLMTWADVSPTSGGSPIAATVFGLSSIELESQIVWSAVGMTAAPAPWYIMATNTPSSTSWMTPTMTPAFISGGCLSNASAVGSSTGAMLYPSMGISICDNSDIRNPS